MVFDDRNRLEQYGLTQDETDSRLSQMSDQQVHNFALQLDDVKIGGDGLDIIAALLAIVMLAVILFYL